ncbi:MULTISPECIES: class I SAM-dependent methyltransferase [unclassified Methylophaga]|uniref:class I SAM-dependent methyltransferase n=1 Tax=unclassified Methylophaga TaxID=2629249 RepID=UPI000C985381|nr:MULTISPECIES: SAM-dependent methyltransferase [unclassified Methylophaga]MBN45648.1 SAM-dependent methyltransferase [Methylophaga sp.]|tara:strand:- start:18565 stop:19728 length:1164 start_codon:yes stop_codon:yes gene_type:complete
MKHTAKLPAPDPIAQQHSDQLLQLIFQTIEDRNGWLSFAEFMQMALYQPGLGYYSNGLSKIGEAGDFITAPEISPLFSMALGNHIADVLRQIPAADCLEFGAGSGQMAVDLLLYLSEIDCLPKHYYIIEASAHLREVQRQKINKIFGVQQNRVVWLDQLPNKFTGVIVANEVCDAMPIHQVLFEKDQLHEIGVGLKNAKLDWQTQPLTNTYLKSRCEQIHPLLEQFPYQTEIAMQATAWLATIADMLEQGGIYIIDYGYEASDYFHPLRHQGMLRCHYHHQAHNDPLILVGLQDITAHVDFTALAETAYEKGLQVEGYQRQSDFLLAGDILNLSQDNANPAFHQMQQAAALKRLLLPQQMGELFKVLSMAKNVEMPRSKSADLRYRL